MVKKFLIIILTSLAIACSTSKDNINCIPMYGHRIKEQSQVDADNKFIKACDNQFKTRKEASDNYSKFAWKYYENGDFQTAMKRFNQAWLLDSTNCIPYWGFGVLLGIKDNMSESNIFLNRSIDYGCSSSYIYESMISNYIGLYSQKKEKIYLDSAFNYIDKGLKLDSKNARIYNQKSICFYYNHAFDSALVYAKNARLIDTNSVTLAYIEMLSKKK
jgi:tetratricopeptide (TPR) repeat protein